MIKLDGVIENKQRVSAYFDDVKVKVGDMSEPIKEANRYMRGEINKNYGKEGGVVTSKWAALNPEYAKRKRKGSKILVDTGKMKKAFYSKFGKNQVEIGNRSSYFKYHQSNKPRTKLPRRAMIEIKNEQQAEIFRFFTKFLNKITNG